MAKKVERRARFLSKFEANHELLEQLKNSGNPIKRDTFKRYIENAQLVKIERDLGYRNNHGQNLAKDNLMIEYWKCKFPEINKDVFIYKPSPSEFYVFS